MPGRAWTVYLLLCADGAYYCGVSSDLARRLRQHNGELAGGAKYTAARRPVRLLAKIDCPDKSGALRLERHVKSLRRPAKLKYFLVKGRADALF